MRLTEIADASGEPLLITMITKIIRAEKNNIWIQGAYGAHQVEGFGPTLIDRPRTHDRPEFHGRGYQIQIDGSVGFAMAPDEADDWTLERRSDGDWTLKKVKK